MRKVDNFCNYSILAEEVKSILGKVLDFKEVMELMREVLQEEGPVDEPRGRVSKYY